MKGLEYLDAAVLRHAWSALDEHVHQESAAHPDGVRGYLQRIGPQWRFVGRVTFHLAENKRDEMHPFAFLATYASRVSARGEAQHLPLARALREYAGAANAEQLVALLTPIHEAAQRLPWVQELVDAGDLHQALAWSPAEAHRLLRDLPALEASGLIVRIPDWWKPERPPRPQVSVRIGERRKGGLGADALLDFSAAVTLGGEPLTEQELRELRATADGLIRLRGQWVEIDRAQLTAALAHWKQVEREARAGGVSFFEGMRLLAGVDEAAASAAADIVEPVQQWSGVEAGNWLQELLARLRDPRADGQAAPADLRAVLRPYQAHGVHWLRLRGPCSTSSIPACWARRAFGRIAKRMEKADGSYAPLRRLVQPYILRRLKTDRRVIADLPEKTEVRAFCGLSREQAALYAERVRELAARLQRAQGIQRRGIVLGYLMQLKQICNHPAPWQGGGGDYGRGGCPTA